ncbi:MAG: glycosyltransferase family 4 protein [Nodosilinea sp. WJT8-NPBG4]|jgi:glycosyltransferase involved in cell wall biosynthesis|nr:glycosyltransferase family 4 protein [Nodosilinea sp. WJT8-NPBG4]
MSKKNVFYIGLRYAHHASYSGYEGFCQYTGKNLESPVQFRWMKGPIGWNITLAVNFLAGHAWYSPGAFLTELASLKHMCSNQKSIYHILYGDSDLLLLNYLTRLTNNLLIATFHQPSPDLKKHRIVEKFAQHLDAVILVSESQRYYFETVFPKEKIFVVPHGINTDFFSPPCDYPLNPVCITVGSHLRDFDTLGEAIKQVWESKPDVNFVAVGARSNKKFYFGNIDDERILFLDRITDEELLKAYQTSQVAVFSFQEATANNAILESMACGLPIITTNIGGTPEYVDEANGLLVPPKTSDALADSILLLLDDHERCRKMAENSRSKALNYEYNIVANKMADIYSKIHCLKWG